MKGQVPALDELIRKRGGGLPAEAKGKCVRGACWLLGVSDGEAKSELLRHVRFTIRNDWECL